MNPENSASDAGKQFDLSSISHTFRMNWIIPFEKFGTEVQSREKTTDSQFAITNPGLFGGSRTITDNTGFSQYAYFNSQNPKPVSPIESSLLFDFKDLKIYPFHFKLFREGHNENSLFGIGIKTKGPSNILIEYALVSVRKRLFYLKVANKTIPDHLKGRQLTSGILRSISPKPETITIVCRIRASSDVHSSTSAIAQGNTTDHEQRLVFECLFPTKEHTPVNSDWETTVSSTPTEAVAKYLSSGELPCLNVELAKQLIADQPCPDELKAWCVEYLMVNLVPENVVGILRIAVEHELKDLLTQCTEYLATQCDVKKK